MWGLETGWAGKDSKAYPFVVGWVVWAMARAVR